MLPILKYLDLNNNGVQVMHQLLLFYKRYNLQYDISKDDVAGPILLQTDTDLQLAMYG
jgi:hypothetical protein